MFKHPRCSVGLVVSKNIGTRARLRSPKSTWIPTDSVKTTDPWNTWLAFPSSNAFCGIRLTKNWLGSHQSSHTLLVAFEELRQPKRQNLKAEGHFAAGTQQKNATRSLSSSNEFMDRNWPLSELFVLKTTSQSLLRYSARLIQTSPDSKHFCWVLFVRIKRDPPVFKWRAWSELKAISQQNKTEKCNSQPLVFQSVYELNLILSLFHARAYKLARKRANKAISRYSSVAPKESGIVVFERKSCRCRVLPFVPPVMSYNAHCFMHKLSSTKLPLYFPCRTTAEIAGKILSQLQALATVTKSTLMAPIQCAWS